jgi:hypothetical protein
MDPKKVRLQAAGTCGSIWATGRFVLIRLIRTALQQSGFRIRMDPYRYSSELLLDPYSKKDLLPYPDKKLAQTYFFLTFFFSSLRG